MRRVQEARSKTDGRGRGRGRGGKGRGRGQSAKPKASPKVKAKAKGKSKAKAKAKTQAEPRPESKVDDLAMPALDEEDAKASALPKPKPKAKAKAKGKGKAKAKALAKGFVPEEASDADVDQKPLHKDPLVKRLFTSPPRAAGSTPLRRAIFNTPLRRKEALMHSPDGVPKAKAKAKGRASKKADARPKSDFLIRHELDLPASFARRPIPKGFDTLERYARIVVTFRHRIQDTLHGSRSLAEAWWMLEFK